jgi:exopolyphosphatase/guanosine-5'-triphosphate,3'-diphosphate pyrophosphatase
MQKAPIPGRGDGRASRGFTRVPNDLETGSHAGEDVAALGVSLPARSQPAVPPPRPQRAPAYAALDLGTNNCRLLVAVPDATGFRVIDAFSRIVRLGEGLFTSGRISQTAQIRALAALAVCRDKLRDNRVARSRLVATEACRAATNGPAFLDLVRNELGLDLELIDRETEARLAVEGCAPLFAADVDSALLFDIGGGSTELAWITDVASDTPRIAEWVSLPVGVVTLAERHGGRDVSPELFAAMIEEVARLLDAFPPRSRITAAARAGRFHLLGTSGTVTTVAGLHLGLRRYDRRKVDGVWLREGDVSEVVETILGLSFAERASHPCIGAERADLVLAGCAILEAIRDAFPARRLRVADRGLREGILVGLMRADGTLGRGAR